MKEVLNVILCHHPASAIPSILARWNGVASPENILLAHGGREADFREIDFPAKVFVSDQRLRTRDHQREMQSITGVLHTVRDWLVATAAKFEFLHLAEYDQLPLVTDLNERQVARIEAEQADLLAFHLERVDGTNRSHYLNHANDSRFHKFFAELTTRRDPDVVFLMLGAGSFWRRAAFDDVSSREEPFRIYNEIYLPTLAHHLGYRVRDFGEQNVFFSSLGDRRGEIETGEERGAWMLHPVKDLGVKRRH